MKKFTSVIAVLVLVASIIVLPTGAKALESTALTALSNDVSISLSLTDQANVSLASGSQVNQETVKLNWTAIEGAESYKLYSWSDTRASGVRLLNAVQISPSAAVDSYTTTSANFTLPRDGTYYFAVKALNSDSIEITTSNIVNLVYDTVPPKIAIINPKSNQEIIGNSLIVNGTVSDANLDYYNFILRNSAGDVLLTSARIVDSVINDVIANLDINTFLSGSYDIAFVARDKAGNESSVINVSDTASFIVLRKGNSNNFSNPPRPQEPAAIELVPALVMPAQATKKISPEFKLVSSPSVLGAISNQTIPAKQPPQNKSQPDATIIAVAKNPAKATDSKLYLAFIPVIFVVMLLAISSRQTVSDKFTNN